VHANTLSEIQTPPTAAHLQAVLGDSEAGKESGSATPDKPSAQPQPVGVTAGLENAPESSALGMTSGGASSAAPTKGHPVKGKITYSGEITRGGVTFGARDFGDTLSNPDLAKGSSVNYKSGTFEVSATLKHSIHYDVRSGTGPSGQTDIASEDDPDIKKTNYPEVVSDLTPGKDGCPPRNHFWAEDLTLKHELVHANDYKENGPVALAKATTWLNGQIAANVEQVKTLYDPFVFRFASALRTLQPKEDSEKQAYLKGAPDYEARAKAIKTKGDNKGYK